MMTRFDKVFLNLSLPQEKNLNHQNISIQSFKGSKKNFTLLILLSMDLYCTRASELQVFMRIPNSSQEHIKRESFNLIGILLKMMN